MEELIDELKNIMPFKDTTDIGDIVLIAGENPQMLLYGYVTDIERDTAKKDEWWHLSISLFTVPLQEVVWTLRTPQMTGMEIFTMGGNKRFIKAVNLAVKEGFAPLFSSETGARKKAVKTGEKRGQAKILPFKKPGS